MNQDTIEDLARLKAIAGERQARDSSNNPQIPDEKVPKGSAAAKTSSALASYTKGLQAEDETGASVRSDMTSTIPSSIDGEPTALRDEPKLIAKIGAQAQDASTTEGAQHFDNAAQKLDEAYKQDQEWRASSLKDEGTIPILICSTGFQILARREFVANSSLPGTFFGPQLNQRAKAEGAVRYTSHTEYWDDNCGCMATKTAVYFTTLRTTRTLRPTVTLPTNRPPASTPTGVSGSSADSDYDKSNNPDAGDFVGLWLGVMGGCLQRQSGVLVCTGSAFSPNFAEIYEQVELPQNITALLPNGTDGAPAGILMGIVSFGVGGGLYAASQFQSVIRYAPGQWVMQGTDSDPTMLDPRQ
ncbi:hypothetical protein EMMF5_000325 [Cystobasidiomycetes sp. EMM_F5]